MNSSKMNSAKFARVWGETERKIYMVYVLLANGFEEVEAIEPIDILRRCGAEVKTASVMKTKEVCGARGITVTADIMISELDPENMEMVMLPGGGMGHELLDASNDVHGVINYAVSHGRYVAAICAAPSILGKKHLLNGKKATCFPGFEKYLYGAEVSSGKVVTDGKFITAKGAGAAADFGFELAKILCGAEKAEEIRTQMQY